MNGFASLYLSLLVACVEFLIPAAFEIRLTIGLGRRPGPGLLARTVRGMYRPVARPCLDAAWWGALLIAYQWFPLNQERLFGGVQPPDHITGAGVIVAELLFGAYLWISTRPEPAV